MKRKRCERCRKMFDTRDLTNWLDDMDLLSPNYCADCYEWIVEHYQEGMDIENMDDDEFFNS